MATSTVTYQQLHMQSVVTINLSLLSQNFQILDKFMKDFGQFQRKFSDLEKLQKATQQDLSNFKVSTLNSFSNINEVVESRAGLQKGPVNLADNQEIKQIKKNFSEIKKFITQNTRDQHQAQQIRDKEVIDRNKEVDRMIEKLNKDFESADNKGKALDTQIRQMKMKLATKHQLQTTRIKVSEIETALLQTSNTVNQIQALLNQLNVKEMKNTIEDFKNKMKSDMEQIKLKLKLKTDISDTLKLEEMLLNLNNYTYQHICKKFADKGETKKALTFIEKRINKLMQTLYGQQEGDKEALLAIKAWKCISCSKDLGQLQGRLDKYKPWSIFPTKQSPVKDRYSGFGAGFQSIVETTATKKGVQISYDEKGRMTTPFNLTRQVQTNLLKPSQSQTKMTRDSSGMKSNSVMKNHQNKPMQMQTNFMGLYGKNNETDIDLKEEYGKKYNGLLAFLNVAYTQKYDSEI